MRFCWLAVLLLLAIAAAPASAQSRGPLRVTVDGSAPRAGAVVHIQGLLGDPALREALASGLPLRLHLRAELWKKGFFDRLIGDREWDVAVLRDPLTEGYTVESDRAAAVLPTAAEAEAVLAEQFVLALEPRGRGRFYYLATLEVETLSLSDLDELRRWLRGEVQPVVRGRARAERAVGRGLQRAVVRVLGLPTRRYEARSATFRVR